MIREYTIRVSEEDVAETYATLTKNGVYIEVPKGERSEEETQLQIDNALLHTALGEFRISQCRDDVYCDKVIVRQDYTTGLDEGQELIQELQAVFPDYENWNKNKQSMAGRYTAYREPYSNSGISFYNFGDTPSESLLLSFNTSYPNSNLLKWYGLKFDLDTKQVMLKVLLAEYSGEKPDLPYNSSNFYAVTHNQDGTESEWVDCYVYATPKRIREFCAEKGLSYPLPPTTHTDCDVVWCWGFVFNKTTLEYGPVKAYARYNIL